MIGAQGIAVKQETGMPDTSGACFGASLHWRGVLIQFRTEIGEVSVNSGSALKQIHELLEAVS